MCVTAMPRVTSPNVPSNHICHFGSLLACILNCAPLPRVVKWLGLVEVVAIKLLNFNSRNVCLIPQHYSRSNQILISETSSFYMQRFDVIRCSFTLIHTKECER